MNKIVREHYPVDRLPEDLRRELQGATSVRVTVEPAETAGQRRLAALEQTRKLREKGVIRPITEREAVDRVRRLRDE